MEVEDAATHRRYVILPAAAYQALYAAAGRGGARGDGFASAAGYMVAADALADVWDDPGLDEYADVPAADDGNETDDVDTDDVETDDGDAA